METKMIQFTAGKGSVECQWVVAKVLKAFLKQVKTDASMEYILLHRVEGEQNGSLQSVVLEIKGNDLENFLMSWKGTIQWKGYSPFRKNHKRKNWFIGCFKMEKWESKECQWNEVQFKAIRSKGAGGQNVNKVNTCVQATHLPSGIQVKAMTFRSQFQNKQWAFERLKSKVNAYYLSKRATIVDEEWKNHHQLERGNPVRIFSGSDFKSEYKEKRYKKRREELKNELRKWY